MAYILGIDIGTSGTKAALFTADGAIVASHTVDYPLYQPENGWAEQDPADWWNAVCASTSAVIAKSGVKADDIKSVGLSGQMHGLVMLDGDGNVLRRSIIWCDQRTGKECDEMTRILTREKLISITANPALTGFTASKILWVRNNEPSVYEKCKHILLPKDYIRYMLTGEFATEVSDASGMQLLDVPKRNWSDEVLGKLSIDKSLLGKVYESVEVTGTVHKEASARTGLAAGTIVVGGAGDNAAAAVGTGTVANGSAFVTIGTSGVVYAHTDKPAIDPSGRVHTFCCAVPNEWHVMGVTQAAGLSLKWFRDNFCLAEIETARGMGIDPYELMTAAAERIPVGAERLLYLPYLMGERTPHLDPDCRGVFFGLSALHTKNHMLRAVMEGVTYSLNDCLAVLREMQVAPARLTACGGGGKSPFWRQMLADICGCGITTIHASEGAALGAAILGAVGAGLYKTVREACSAIIRVDTLSEPDEAAAAQYAKGYKLYTDLYPQMQSSFKTLAQI